MFFLRTNRSILNRWWWQIDRIAFCTLLCLISLGLILSFAATPSLAQRLGHDAYYFVKRHIFYLVPSIFILIGVSLLNPVQIRKFSFLGFLLILILLIMTPLMGTEIKGAKRWIVFFGISIQTAEFVKPFFAVMSAWLLTKQQMEKSFPGFLMSLLLYFFILGLLVLQPDMGMAFVLSSSFFCQLFIAGMPYMWVGIIVAFMLSSFTLGYLFFPHVYIRVNHFLFGEHYQVTKSLEAISKGGFWGQGPGEGSVKYFVPDGHSDFIFSVAAEEFGVFFCMLIVFLFVLFTYRIFVKMYKTKNFFIILACGGIITQLCLQSIINIASSLNLIPTKGMTLPFISYGGSSILALALACSMLLSLTRRYSGLLSENICSGGGRNRRPHLPSEELGG